MAEKTAISVQSEDAHVALANLATSSTQQNSMDNEAPMNCKTGAENDTLPLKLPVPGELKAQLGNFKLLMPDPSMLITQC